jgi:hypothetical protein
VARDRFTDGTSFHRQSGAGEFLRGFADAGASHMIVRFTGDHERNLETFTRLRTELGWRAPQKTA